MYIRVLPLLIRISPGRFPSQDRAPVQARSPPTRSSSPPPTSHGPHSLVMDRPPRFVPPTRLPSRRSRRSSPPRDERRRLAIVPPAHDQAPSLAASAADLARDGCGSANLIRVGTAGPRGDTWTATPRIWFADKVTSLRSPGGRHGAECADAPG